MAECLNELISDGCSKPFNLITQIPVHVAKSQERSFSPAQTEPTPYLKHLSEEKMYFEREHLAGPIILETAWV